jgi:hypothetical protein
MLIEKNGRFFVYEPRLGVISSGESVERAYEKFVGARRDFLTEIARAGLTAGASTSAASSAPVLVNRPMAGELRLFLVKTCIVLLIIAGVAYAAIIGINQAIAGVGVEIARLGGVGKLSLADVVSKAEVMAIDARDLPADRKELLRQSVGDLSRELAPIIDAWRNPPEKSRQ